MNFFPKIFPLIYSHSKQTFQTYKIGNTKKECIIQYLKMQTVNHAMLHLVVWCPIKSTQDALKFNLIETACAWKMYICLHI